MTYIHIHWPAEATGWWEERVDCTQQLVVSDDELTVVVDIPSQTHGSAPDPEPTQQAPDPPNSMLEPDERREANTAESAEAETPLAVMETTLDSTAQADPEPSMGPSVILETEAAQAACPDVVLSLLLADQMDPVPSNDSPEVATTSYSGHPDPGSLKPPVGSRSPTHLPRRGTRPRKQPERHAPVRRLQVFPVKQPQTGPSVWLFPTIGVAVALRQH